MSAVWENRWAELVRRLAALRETTALELIQDLMPVLPVVDPGDAEYRLLRRERMFHQSLNAPAVAGQASRVRWGNPGTAGSRILAVVEEVRLYSVAAQSVEVTIQSGWGAAASSASVRDMRGISAASPAQSQMNALADATAVLPTIFPTRVFLQAGVQSVVQLGYVLPPGWYVSFTGDLVNTALNASLRWYERACDSSELNPSGA